jgi:hypothetical protein
MILSEANAQLRAEYFSRPMRPSLPMLPNQSGFNRLSDADYQILFQIGMQSHIHYSSQEYGFACQKMLIQSYGMTPNKSSDDCGDAFHPKYGNIEIKVSICNNGRWSLQQIRPWQNIDHYLVFLCDVGTPDIDPFVGLYFIPANVLTDYAAMYGSRSHKVSRVGFTDEVTELGLSIRNPATLTRIGQRSSPDLLGVIGPFKL